MTVFIGDVHGLFSSYTDIILECENSIQVGDLGVGFIDTYSGEVAHDPPTDLMAARGHRFIRGNHDSPSVCRGHPQWIVDGHVEGDMMLMGGGLSIDREMRREGADWWADEELSAPDLNILVGRYVGVRPKVVVTHDCPESVATRMCQAHRWRKLDFPSRTRQALQSMFEAHQPDLWIFGHWHRSFDEVIEGVRFVCLAELEAREFDV